MANKHEYTTSDLALTTTLALSYPITNINRSNPKRIVFSFSNSPELSNTIEQYWSNALQVDPQQFFNQLKLIKNRIYNT